MSHSTVPPRGDSFFIHTPPPRVFSCLAERLVARPSDKTETSFQTVFLPQSREGRRGDGRFVCGVQYTRLNKKTGVRVRVRAGVTILSMMFDEP